MPKDKNSSNTLPLSPMSSSMKQANDTAASANSVEMPRLPPSAPSANDEDSCPNPNPKSTASQKGFITEHSLTQDVLSDVTENVWFEDLGLSPGVLAAITDLGFEHPSPVQLRGIPPARFGSDIVIQSKAGTGKTLVFAVAILENLDLSVSQGLQAMVLAPTREIAHQICGVIRAVGRKLSVNYEKNANEASTDNKSSLNENRSRGKDRRLVNFMCHCFIGGLPLKRDIQTLCNRGCHVAVGTPGRLRQLIELGDLDTSCASMLVIDEADKMLGPGSENGFGPDIAAIVSNFPERRQVMAFSATFPKRLANRIAKMMNNAVIIQECQDDAKTETLGAALHDAPIDNVDADARGDDRLGKSPISPSLLGVAQYYIRVCSSSDSQEMKNSTPTSVYSTFAEKTRLLQELISVNHFNQCIVFCNHRGYALSLSKKLQYSGWPSAFLAGDLPQRERLRVFKQLKDMHIRILVSTDLTARGIDCNLVDLVVNLDLPGNPETYLHRVGRTGRFGSIGAAVTIVDPTEEGAISRLESLYKADITELTRTDLTMTQLKEKSATGNSKFVNDSFSVKVGGTKAGTLFTQKQMDHDDGNSSNDRDYDEDTSKKKEDAKADAVTCQEEDVKLEMRPGKQREHVSAFEDKLYDSWISSFLGIEL